MFMKLILSLCLALVVLNASAQQKRAKVLEVPGKTEFCTINEKGISVLPSGRYVHPA